MSSTRRRSGLATPFVRLRGGPAVPLRAGWRRRAWCCAARAGARKRWRRQIRLAAAVGHRGRLPARQRLLPRRSPAANRPVAWTGRWHMFSSRRVRRTSERPRKDDPLDAAVWQASEPGHLGLGIAGKRPASWHANAPPMACPCSASAWTFTQAGRPSLLAPRLPRGDGRGIHRRPAARPRLAVRRHRLAIGKKMAKSATTSPCWTACWSPTLRLPSGWAILTAWAQDWDYAPGSPSAPRPSGQSLYRRPTARPGRPARHRRDPPPAGHRPGTPAALDPGDRGRMVPRPDPAAGLGL